MRVGFTDQISFHNMVLIFTEKAARQVRSAHAIDIGLIIVIVVPMFADFCKILCVMRRTIIRYLMRKWNVCQDFLLALTEIVENKKSQVHDSLR